MKPYLRVLVKTGILPSLNLQSSVELNGRQVTIPVIAGIGTGHFDPAETWMNRIIKLAFQNKEGAFLDIGVNLGQTLLKFIELQVAGRQYYGFEPNPQCCAYVEKLIDLNGWREVNLVPVGLSDQTFLARMELSSNEDPAGSIVEGYRPADEYSKRKYVPIFRGDELIEQFGITSISMIKIDVEGAESEVLNGLRRTIERTRPFIYCEILPIASYEAADIVAMRREKVDRVLRLLSEIKYSIFRLLHDGNFVPLKTIETHADIALSEYVFLPNESVSDFLSSI